MLQKQSRVVLGIVAVVLVGIYLVFDSLYLSLFISIVGFASLAGYLWYSGKVESEDADAMSKQQRDAARKQLEFETSKLDKIIQAIPSAMVYVNEKGGFDVFNSKFNDLIQNKAKDVYSNAVDPALRRILMDAFLGEKQLYKQVSIGELDYQVLAVPMFQNERYHGCILVFQDITRVRDGEKMQKRFIADASHELKTPIAAIKGMHEILTRDSFDDVSTHDEFMTQIGIEVDRLDKIVNDLLLQSRLSMNKVHLEKTRFALRDFFEGLIYRRRQQLHQGNIEVTLNCSPEILVEADQFRLGQVFINLFNNAINYAQDASIQIDCDVHENECIIRFTDTGKGISEDALPHVFERFFRGQSDRNRNDGGSGLGLAISKAIVEAHSGTMNVTSEPGVGTTFIIAIPLQ